MYPNDIKSERKREQPEKYAELLRDRQRAGQT